MSSLRCTDRSPGILPSDLSRRSSAFPPRQGCVFKVSRIGSSVRRKPSTDLSRPATTSSSGLPKRASRVFRKSAASARSAVIAAAHESATGGKADIGPTVGHFGF
jgi:hypothetical protein